jgi:hypothetical protein
MCGGRERCAQGVGGETRGKEPIGETKTLLFVFVVVGLFGTAAMKAYCTLIP